MKEQEHKEPVAFYTVIIFSILITCIWCFLALSHKVDDAFNYVNARIDHLYTEQGQREMKCKAKGGEWIEDYQMGWSNYDEKSFGVSTTTVSFSRTKIGCFKIVTKSEEVKIEI